MSTVMKSKRKRVVRSRSAFQAHVTTFLPTDDIVNVVDLAERKLRRLATRHPDSDVRTLATRMLADYLNGKISVAFENGNMPVYSFLKND